MSPSDNIIPTVLCAPVCHARSLSIDTQSIYSILETTSFPIYTDRSCSSDSSASSHVQQISREEWGDGRAMIGCCSRCETDGFPLFSNVQLGISDLLQETGERRPDHLQITSRHFVWSRGWRSGDIFRHARLGYAEWPYFLLGLGSPGHCHSFQFSGSIVRKPFQDKKSYTEI